MWLVYKRLQTSLVGAGRAILVAACLLLPVACTLPQTRVFTLMPAAEDSSLDYYAWATALPAAEQYAEKLRLEAQYDKHNDPVMGVQLAMLLGLSGPAAQEDLQRALSILDQVDSYRAEQQPELEADYVEFAQLWRHALQHQLDYREVLERRSNQILGLQQETRQLQGKLERMQEEYEALRKENPLLKEENESLRLQIDALKAIEQQMNQREHLQETP